MLRSASVSIALARIFTRMDGYLRLGVSSVGRVYGKRETGDSMEACRIVCVGARDGPAWGRLRRRRGRAMRALSLFPTKTNINNALSLSLLTQTRTLAP